MNHVVGPDAIEAEYVYNDRWTGTIVFAVAGVAALGWAAVEFPRPDFIKLALAGGLLVFIAALQIVRRIAIRQRIAFTSDALLVPAGWWSEQERAIPYREMHALADRMVGRDRSLIINHRQGEQTIDAGQILSGSYDDLRAQLIARFQQAQPPEELLKSPGLPPSREAWGSAVLWLYMGLVALAVVVFVVLFRFFKQGVIDLNELLDLIPLIFLVCGVGSTLFGLWRVRRELIKHRAYRAMVREYHERLSKL